MIYVVMSFLLVTTASLFGSNERGLLAGEVSPAAPRSSNAPSPSQQSNAPSMGNDFDDDSSEDNGEVDEDIIIMDDEDTNDDEGVTH